MGIVQIARQSSAAKRLYHRLRTEASFSPDSLLTCIPSTSDETALRINLVLLGINKNDVYGGVSTALKVFVGLNNILSAESRIIVTGHEKPGRETFVPDGYSIKRQGNKTLVFLSENQNLDIRANDVFIFTYWSTRYSLDPAICARDSIFPNHELDFYLIQDFEPGFFPWSTEYLLAEATYHMHLDNTDAIVNSSLLMSYLQNNGYSFRKSFVIQPTLSDSLRKCLPTESDFPITKNREIIIYGRPSVDRNAFQLVISSLRIWSAEYRDSEKWKIYSLGEEHDDIQLSRNVVKSCGKLSLEDYADRMTGAFAGVSLMASPHPSYPPLEMSTFGVKTITNRFANKSLDGFNDFIYSVDICNPTSIAMLLKQICDSYERDHLISQLNLNNEYINGNSYLETIDYMAHEITSRTQSKVSSCD